MTDSIQNIILEMKTCVNNESSLDTYDLKDWIHRLQVLTSKPDAYILKTGHGTKIVEEKPECEIDYWKPLYRMEK